MVMRISVALCTYNGERYLPDQLRSIAAQRRLPGELIICDDASTDASAAIAANFAREAPFEVRLFPNPQNGGSTRNFERAISLCRGDAIALCDQDDVWLPEKLARIEGAFQRTPGLALVASDASVVDSELRPLGYRLWEAIRFTPALRHRLAAGRGAASLLKRNYVTGATAAFAASLRPLLFPIPESWLHDAWIAFVASAFGTVAFLPEPLLSYRQHAGQQIGAELASISGQWANAKKQDPGYFRQQARCFRDLLEHLQRHAALVRDPRIIPATAAKAAFCEARARIKSCSRLPRIPPVLYQTLLGRYHRFAKGWKALAADLLME